MKTTSVYLVGSPTGPVKIGISNSPASRFRALQNGSSVPLSLHGTWAFPTSVARGLERLIHWRLRDVQTHGEWFDIDPSEALDLIVNAIADYRDGERAGRIESSRGRVGRPALHHKSTNVRLPPAQRAEIERLVGARGMASFIRDAIVDRLRALKAIDLVPRIAVDCSVRDGWANAVVSYPASADACARSCARLPL